MYYNYKYTGLRYVNVKDIFKFSDYSMQLMYIPLCPNQVIILNSGVFTDVILFINNVPAITPTYSPDIL